MRTRPWIIAHRGASAATPENTLAALRAAALLGADAVEIDVRPSADGEPIVLHDRLLERTTSGTGPAAERTLAELRTLSAGYPKRFGRRHDAERIPTLSEALTECRALNLRLAIEIKTEAPAPALVGRVVAEIGAADMAERCWIWSFLWPNLAAVRAHSPDLRRGALSLSFPGPELVAHSELLVPFAAHWLLVDKGTARRAHKPIFTWTVNRPAVARRLAEHGSQGIITDRPDRIAAHFDMSRRPIAGG